jgi:hypothetical protein
MKNKPIILFLGLLLCGCSHKQAIDLVKSGEFTTWSNGYVLYVDKRVGDSLTHIQVTSKTPDKNIMLTANDGVIAAGPDADSIKLTLHTVRSLAVDNAGIIKSAATNEQTIILHELYGPPNTTPEPTAP